MCVSNAYHSDTQREPCKLKMNVEMPITICIYAFLESFWQCRTEKWILSLFLHGTAVPFAH